VRTHFLPSSPPYTYIPCVFLTAPSGVPSPTRHRRHSVSSPRPSPTDAGRPRTVHIRTPCLHAQLDLAVNMLQLQNTDLDIAGRLLIHRASPLFTIHFVLPLLYCLPPETERGNGRDTRPPSAFCFIGLSLVPNLIPVLPPLPICASLSLQDSPHCTQSVRVSICCPPCSSGLCRAFDPVPIRPSFLRASRFTE
jgi:hypothetical protein